MTTDPPAARPGGPSLIQRVPLVPVGSRRVESTLARMVSVFGLLFALQSVPLLVGDWHPAPSVPGAALAVAVYGAVLAASFAGLLLRATRVLFVTAGIVYLLAVVLWPFASSGAWAGGSAPWLFALSGVPCGFVIVGTRGAVPFVYVGAVATAIAAVRTRASAGSLALPEALREGGYACAIGIGLVLVVIAVRRAAEAVDRAQGAALTKYAGAQIDEATETERVRTDALVHDSVLTTFLSAASAQTPDAQRLAARMAGNAMQVLSRATVASHAGPKVAVRDLLDRIRHEAAGLGDRFAVTVRDVGEHVVPETVADAVVTAAVQAMSNSVKHAGGPEVPRSLSVQGTVGGGVRVTVADEGRGFDPATASSVRLGLRVSIMERMSRVGGEVELTTAPGRGTTFVLSWPAAEPDDALPDVGLAEVLA